MIDSVSPSEGPTHHGNPGAPKAGDTSGQAPTSRDDLSRNLHDLIETLPNGTADAAVLQASLEKHDPMSLVDRVMNLGEGGASSLLGSFADYSREEMEEALKILVELLRRGVVGYEYREINGEPHKVFIDVAIGSDYSRAKLWRGSRLDGLI